MKKFYLISLQSCSAKTFTTLLFVLAVCMGVVYWMAISFTDSGVEKYEENRAVERAKKAAEIREKYEKQLSTYGWVDEAQGIVHIPLEVATKLELEALRQKAVKAGVNGNPVSAGIKGAQP